MTSSVIPPCLLLDGHLVAASYGLNAFQMPAGPHRLELYAQWMRRYGQAQLDVLVPDGGVLDTFYAAPLHQFTTGSIGFERQRRKGVGLILIFVGFLLAMVVAGVILALTLS